MPTGLIFAIDRLSINCDIEDAFAARDQAKILDDMLVVTKQLLSHAHGVIRIVSRNAVANFDSVTHGTILHPMVGQEPEFAVISAYDNAMGFSAVVIYESLTGNTAKAGQLIAAELAAQGVSVVACPITRIDHQALSEADLVIVGSWTDGIFLFGQRPGRAGRLAKLPVIDGKKAAVYCTYALDAGKTLEKLSDIVAKRGGDMMGGVAIKRDNLPGGAAEFADRLLGAWDKIAA